MNELTIETARIFEPLTQPSRYKGAWGGRGSGKSHFMAGAVVEHLEKAGHGKLITLKANSA